MSNAPSFSPGDWQAQRLPDDAQAPRGLPVSNSAELQRILDLPRRPQVTEGSPTAHALVQLMMQKYSRGARQCRCKEIDERRPCITSLMWIQAWMLYEIEAYGGLIAQVAVGAGKTLVGCLAPLAFRDCRLALLLVPPTLVKQLITEYQMVGEHFHVPNISVHTAGRKTWSAKGRDGAPTLHVLPYSGLSSIENSQWIENLRPDVIIADEVDALKSLSSARTLRLLRYVQEHESTTRFCGWTGSLTDNSIAEVAHLSAMALRRGSPLPTKRPVIDEWSQCLDAVPYPCTPGALIRFLEPNEGINKLRTAFRRRLAETPGFIIVGGKQTVIGTGGHEVGLKVVERAAPPLPDIIREALKKVRDNARPDTLDPNAVDGVEDDILHDPLEQAKCAREVACGFFYRWVFPRGEPRALISEWYRLRKEWNSELRHKILRGEAQLDSAGLCEEAARRAHGDLPSDPNLPDWEADSWPAWRDIQDKVQPQPEAVRLHPFLAEDTAAWGTENTGIIWYANVEFAQWVAELSGLPVHGGGPGAEEAILKERGDRSIIASIKSHGRGRDRLQYVFHHQLLAQMLASSRGAEQLLGRLVRRGQKQKTVITEAYLHTSEVRGAFEQMLLRAQYVEELMGAGQKILEGWKGDLPSMGVSDDGDLY